MRKQIFIFIGIGIALIAFSGCDPASPTSSGENSPLVGTWGWVSSTETSPGGQSVTTQPSDLYSYRYVIKSNKSLTMAMTIFGQPLSYSGSWSSTADSVTITVVDDDGNSSIHTWAYVISDADLTLTRLNDSGNGMNTEVEKYTKQ